VRWSGIVNDKKVGLFAILDSQDLMQLNVSSFTTEQLHKATHNHKLKDSDQLEVLPFQLCVLFNLALSS
jgi:hypothetical protein